MALIASPSVAADRDAERIVTRQVASIVPPDGAGGAAVALRIDGRSEATLLAQAVLKGELGLDDPVAKYVVDLQMAFLAANLDELPVDQSLRDAMALAHRNVFRIGPHNGQALGWEISGKKLA
jgi:hypothetical protein